MSKAKSLTEAHGAYLSAEVVHGEYVSALSTAIDAKDYPTAQKVWKDAHEAVLELKKALNGLYSHLGELKPKKADKLKPGGKLDRPEARPEGAPEKKSGKKGRKAAEFKAGKSGEPGSKENPAGGRFSSNSDELAADQAMSDAASDEPEDDDKNAP